MPAGSFLRGWSLYSHGVLEQESAGRLAEGGSPKQALALAAQACLPCSSVQGAHESTRNAVPSLLPAQQLNALGLRRGAPESWP